MSEIKVGDTVTITGVVKTIGTVSLYDTRLHALVEIEHPDADYIGALQAPLDLLRPVVQM